MTTPTQSPARPAGADALLAAIESVDPQRVARWRYWSHAKRCWTGGDVALCERCRQLDADASAEDWRRATTRAPRLPRRQAPIGVATSDLGQSPSPTEVRHATAPGKPGQVIEPGATSDPTPTASAGRQETGRDVDRHTTSRRASMAHQQDAETPAR